MTAKDWFSVGVRLLGVWMLLQAVSELAWAAELRYGLIASASTWNTTPRGHLLHAGIDIAAALFLLTIGSDLLWAKTAERRRQNDEPIP